MVNIINIFFILFILVIYLSNVKKNRENFKINTKKNSLDNKVILITGSTKGIGYELAKTLVKYNCKIVINGRNKKSVNKVVKELEKTSDNILGIPGDISIEKDVDRIFDKTIEHFKTIDILINNAAIIKGKKDLSGKDFKDWKSEMDVNINGVYLMAQKVIKFMRSKGNKGRIINVSSHAAKLKDTNVRSGSHILSKSFIEKMSEILADENYRYRISITTIRIDEDISTSSLNFLPFEIPKNITSLKKLSSIDSFFASKPSKIIPVFLYAMKAPFYEVSGKLISTSSYLNNPELSKIVPAQKLLLNDKLYNSVRLTKNINYNKNPNIKLLVKQNPIGYSPEVEKLIKNKKFKFNYLNNPAINKYSLSKIVTKDLKLQKNNISFFRSEIEALRKIIDLFITNYGEIIVIYPSCANVFIICNERKITPKYTVLKEVSKGELQPNFYYIIKYITSKTKLIYLSSPNTVTGHSIRTKDFEDFLGKIPKNIPILIDQRYVEFSENKKCLNPLKYLDQNVISLRSFNNFYAIQNLEIAYILAKKDICELLNKSQVLDNQIDDFNERLAILAYKDMKHNNKVRKYIRKEKERLYKILKDRNINFFPSETNYFLVETNKNRGLIKKDLEKRDIILYESDDAYNSYWTLPISDKKTNSKVINIITSHIS